MSVHDPEKAAPPPAAPPAAAPSAAGRRLGLALLVIATAQLMLVLDDTIVNVALPDMQRSLHIAAPHLNWVASFYALAFGGLLLAGGRAGDLFGRLRMFRSGIIVFALASMAGGFAPNGTALLMVVADSPVGKTIRVKVNRDGKEMTLPITIVDRQEILTESARNGRGSENGNEQGEASHAKYKDRQKKAVIRRLQLGMREMKTAVTAARPLREEPPPPSVRKPTEPPSARKPPDGKRPGPRSSRG